MPQPSFGKNALIILTAESVAAAHTAIDEIARLGGHIVHVYPPRVLIGDVPAEADHQVRALANVGRFYRNRVDLAEVEPFGPAVVQAVKGWNRGFAASFRALKSGRSSEGRSWGAPGYAAEGPVQAPPGHRGSDVPGRPTAAGADTSAYLIGKVATSIVLVEGTAARYSFSPMERDTVVAEIQDGLGWLARCEPRARVSWFYEVSQIRLDIDPARLADFSEDTWRDAAMAKLGYPASWDGLEQYVRDRRTALGTEWAFAIFVTRFPLWHFAYAFKPRVVVNLDLDGWGVDNLDRIIAHETAHIFGAADEYAESKCDCQERWGFLQVENGNCELGAEHHEPCIMSHNAWAMCEFTRGHLGWRDSNGDGVFDPLDRQPAVAPKPWWARWLARLRRLLKLDAA
jgi:hypothetical protein